MAIELKNGAVFLHIPKTGGNWVTKVLLELDLIERSVGRKHADIDHFFLTPPIRGRKALLKHTAQRLLNPQSLRKTPYMFCFVRNPLSWYESWFKYMSQSSRQWRFWGDEQDIYKWHPNAILNGLGHCGFEEFVRNVNKKRPGYVTELYGWYTKPQMDFIGRQEYLADDLIKVLNLMKIDFDEDFVRGFGKVGVSSEPKKQVIWPDDLKMETTLHEYAGMIRYGYHSTLEDIGVGVTQLTRRCT